MEQDMQSLMDAVSGRNPREDQAQVAEEVIRWIQGFEKGNKGVVVEMPTGAGKTLTTMMMIRHLINNDPHIKVAFMVHRRELFKQTLDEFIKVFGKGVINITAGERETHKKGARIRLYMEQTITSKFDKIPNYQMEKCDVLFIDECHSMNYQSFLDAIIKSGTAVVGLSATPDDWRLRRFWHPEKIVGATQETLEKLGVLVEPTFYTSKPIDEIARRYAEGDVKTAKSIAFRTVIKYITTEMRKVESDVGRELMWIVKTQKKRQAIMLAEWLNKHDIASRAFYSGKGGGNKSDIDNILDGKAKERVAVVVQRFSVGYDHPGIQGIVLTGAMKYSLFVQTVGRALRPGWPRRKDNAYVVDLAGNLVNHLDKYIKRRLDPTAFLPEKIVKEKRDDDSERPEQPQETLSIQEQHILLHKVILSHLDKKSEEIDDACLIAYCSVLAAHETGADNTEEGAKKRAKRAGQNFWVLTGRHAGGRVAMRNALLSSKEAMIIWSKKQGMPMSVMQELKAKRREYAVLRMNNQAPWRR